MCTSSARRSSRSVASGSRASTLTDVTPGRYRHFKGTVYVVVGTATHSESEESFVVYHREGDERLWVRPVEMWAEHVERDGYAGPRFIALEG